MAMGIVNGWKTATHHVQHSLLRRPRTSRLLLPSRSTRQARVHPTGTTSKSSLRRFQEKGRTNAHEQVSSDVRARLVTQLMRKALCEGLHCGFGCVVGRVSSIEAMACDVRQSSLQNAFTGARTEGW